ncbi:hypothetical protein BDN71DRAFT_918238 [Pleurotus eryngii]|uniref:Uncharacterized protein n=1 Tax=Pleurotus eryngii TaxID=5323 RepID=A0A9P5ZYZ5_PLEER|nr:hypothetical protein BDN71DRAFT_918238 [Pleurotus eryngii]
MKRSERSRFLTYSVSYQQFWSVMLRYSCSRIYHLATTLCAAAPNIQAMHDRRTLTWLSQVLGSVEPFRAPGISLYIYCIIANTLAPVRFFRHGRELQDPHQRGLASEYGRHQIILQHDCLLPLMLPRRSTFIRILLKRLCSCYLTLCGFYHDVSRYH